MRRSKNNHLHFNGYVFKPQIHKTSDRATAKHYIVKSKNKNKQTMTSTTEQKTHTLTCWNENEKKNKKNHQMECFKTDSSYCNQNSTCAYKLSRFFRLLLLLTLFAFFAAFVLFAHRSECSARAYNLRLNERAITCLGFCERSISMDLKIHVRRLARQCLCVR